MHIKINNTFIDNVEDLDIAMPMYNLLEYKNNYSMTPGNLWNYYRDEVNEDTNENDNDNNDDDDDMIVTMMIIIIIIIIIG